MISRTLGAPLGGTTVGGQYGLESGALRPISPPNLGGGPGKYLPSIVVVALGEPGVPVIGAVDGGSGQPGPGKDSFQTDDTVWFAHGRAASCWLFLATAG